MIIPYRSQTQALIDQHVRAGKQVLHLSVHSFPASYKGLRRNAAMGLIYDSKRHGEQEVSRILCRLLQQQTPAYHARVNYPYSSKHDNFAKTLRLQYAEPDLLNIDLELNQSLLNTQDSINHVTQTLSNSLRELMQLL